AHIEHQIARGPSMPLSKNDLREKFLDCAAACLEPARAEDLFDGLMAIDSRENIATLMAQAVP
ncbi:MAG: hypothetical protein ACO3MW_09485, partial [Rhodospirillales bacterium]